jgi:hypothetical protein
MNFITMQAWRVLLLQGDARIPLLNMLNRTEIAIGLSVAFGFISTIFAIKAGAFDWRGTRF